MLHLNLDFTFKRSCLRRRRRSGRQSSAHSGNSRRIMRNRQRVHLHGQRPWVVRTVTGRQSDHPDGRMPRYLVRQVTVTLRNSVTLRQRIGTLNSRQTRLVTGRMTRTATGSRDANNIARRIMARRTPHGIRARRTRISL